MYVCEGGGRGGGESSRDITIQCNMQTVNILIITCTSAHQCQRVYKLSCHGVWRWYSTIEQYISLSLLDSLRGDRANSGIIVLIPAVIGAISSIRYVMSTCKVC